MKQLCATAVLLAFTLAPPTLAGQGPAIAGAEARPGRLSFDVASVKVDKAGLPPQGPRQSLDVKDGYFSMVNCGVFCLISFAYHLSPDELVDIYPQLGGAMAERFDVEARGNSNATEDDVRLMVQSLLADRFKFAMHYETRQKPIYQLVLAKPGKLGPNLKAYSTGEEPCVDHPTPMQAVPGGFPASCGVRQLLRASQTGDFREGGRNMSIAQISALFRVYGRLDRAVVDDTGLTGTYDYILEWTANASASPVANDSTGTTFIEALQDQLGLKLKAATGTVNAFIVDHIEQPSAN